MRSLGGNNSDVKRIQPDMELLAADSQAEEEMAASDPLPILCQSPLCNVIYGE